MKRFFTAKFIFLLFIFLCSSLFCYAEIKSISRDPSDLFIFYSTSPGGVAMDGAGRNSPFAEAFLNNIQKNEPLNLLASDIVSDTLKLTGRQQRPSYDSQIVNNKMFSIANRSSPKKYALIIGNSNYQYWSKIKNASNDAQDIAVALLRLGYDVVLKIDANQAEMESAIYSFTANLKSEKESEGFFWFAGMGVQAYGSNYLLPVNDNSQSSSEMIANSFSLDILIGDLKWAGNKINVACFDTFAPSWGR